MEVEQGVHLRIDDEDDAAAPAAISAIGAAQRLEFRDGPKRSRYRPNPLWCG